MREFNERLQIFTENKRRVQKHNEGNHSFTSKNIFSKLHFLQKHDSCVVSLVSFLPAVGLNQFSDMTFVEFKKYFLLSEPQVTPSIQEQV